VGAGAPDFIDFVALFGDDAVQPKLKLHFIFFELELNLADVKEELKFLLRLNRLLAPILLVAFAGVNYLVWRDLQKTYEGATVEIARAMLETAHAMRAYTTQEIAPLLEGDPGLPDRTAKRIHEILGADLSRNAQKRTGVRGANAGPALQPALGSIEDRLRQELVTPLERPFAPQTVPAYAATRAFGFFRQKFPEFDEWAKTQMALANALEILGERTNGTAELEGAVETLHGALSELPQERFANEWTSAQMRLANTLEVQGERGGGADKLKQAIDAYRSALEIPPRAVNPHDWAMVKPNLCNALRALGSQGNQRGALEEAVEVCREALQEFTRAQTPRNWGGVQLNLARIMQRK